MPKVKIGNTSLFFDIYGSKLDVQKTDVKEKPTLLVLHGGHGMADHTLYVEFWSQFSKVAQIIFLDQRGCGRSDRCDSSEWNLRQWGQDVFDFCEALDIKKPIVMGLSMGGHVLCEYATQHPQHPGALVFCNTEAKFDLDLVAEKFEARAGKDVAEIVRQNFMAPTPEIVKLYQERCVPFYAKNAYTQTEMKRCQQRMEIFEHYCKNEMKTFTYLDKLGGIVCPVLFMVGEESTGHPVKAAEKMAAKMKKELVTYHLFKGAGAPVYKDSLKESLEVVNRFISQISSKSNEKEKSI